jgi:hypothetical protein
LKCRAGDGQRRTYARRLTPDSRVRGVLDFRGDGRAEIVFRRSSDGILTLYLMNGFQIVVAQPIGAIGTEWGLLGVRDFNGDARADMLFRHSDGTLLLYLVDGFRIVAAQVLGTVVPSSSSSVSATSTVTAAATWCSAAPATGCFRPI